MFEFLHNSPALGSSLTVLAAGERPLTLEEMQRLIDALNSETVTLVLTQEYNRTLPRSQIANSKETAMNDETCPAAHDCCAAAIQALADAAAACCDQHACHERESNTKGCDSCKEALTLTLDAMQKHLDCLRGCC